MNYVYEFLLVAFHSERLWSYCSLFYFPLNLRVEVTTHPYITSIECCFGLTYFGLKWLTLEAMLNLQQIRKRIPLARFRLSEFRGRSVDFKVSLKGKVDAQTKRYHVVEIKNKKKT